MSVYDTEYAIWSTHHLAINRVNRLIPELLAADRGLKERVEDGMHVVRITWGTGWACIGRVRVMKGTPP